MIIMLREKVKVRKFKPSVCEKCGKKGKGIITRFGINYCRHCFREEAKRMGFKKYH